MAPPPPCYASDFFDALTSVDDIERVAADFENLLFDNRDHADLILERLVVHERPEVVRLVLSYIDENWVINRFPSTPAEFNASFAQRILSQLSSFFQFTPTTVIDRTDAERPVDERPDKRRAFFRQLVKDAPDALAALIPRLSHSDPEPIARLGIAIPNTKMSQKQIKQARRAAAKTNAPLNPGPFDRLEIPVPENREEAELAANVILDNQKTVLEAYLEALHSPDLEASIRAACLPKELALPPQPQIEEGQQPKHPETVSQQPAPVDSEGPYTGTQLMKFTQLYCDSATGFGEWAINISPRGERDLRDHSRRDRKIFKIILKKIRELSNGHFSPDNQKRLNNNHVEIPIYEAKMTGDLRLVYQIDCIPAYDSTSERQAIKIFGVYTHAQIARVSFWDTMGRELGKRGKEYKDRCAFRKAPHHAGDHVFSPSTFPAPAEVRALPPGCAPDLPPDDLEQMQSLLLKSVHFSQPLLNSIIADLDVAFVLQVSPREQAIIEHPYSCYVLGRSGTGKTTTMLYKMLLVEADYEISQEENPNQEIPKRRQLFVTQSRILAEKVEEHFTKLSAGYRPSANAEKATKANTATAALVDIDDELNWRSDLPTRYSDLRDEHFPLFVTFDRLCGMLENDMADEPSTGFVVSADPATDRARPARLTYDRFLQHYWPHFPQILTKGLDPSMVFSEFMGVIMGSEETTMGESSCLDRDTYLNLSERAQSTFAGRRQRIYNLFESYVNRKRQLRDIDAADRTHAILGYFDRRGGVPGRKMDYLYVDEIQDNLLIDTLLLRSICHNPNGCFWAGDTAQTISVGSSFRFNELKSFLFHIEQRRLEMNTRPKLYHQPTWQPRTFQLTVNYRSHAGIVNCAHTVVEIITRFWPYAIDVLDRERGTVDGLRPVFFTGFHSGNVQYEQFLFGDREGSYIEFGAQQCILVRDDAAREKLREQVGDIGLIMTLYESKGLEFNDVLLYNFFEDSTVNEAQWRVVLNALETPGQVENVPAPLFDETRHAGVCSELKFLYVAITRARNNVWIADTSPKGEPMRILWTSKDQVQNCTPGTDTPRLAISSTAAEWEEQGRKLFANKRYRQSKHCFERAVLPRQAAMAGAYYLRQEARKSSGGSNRRAIEARKDAFLEAAAAFIDCAREDKTLAYFRIAAECFEDAGDDLQAAQTFRDAEEYTRSAELYRKLGHFDDAVYLIKNHRRQIRPEVITNVTNVARLFYFKEQKLDKANALFSSYEEALEYLQDRGLDIAHATLLESLGRFSDAAEVHLEEGRTFDAIKLFLQDPNETSMRRGIQCVLQCLWQRVSFAVLPDNGDSSVSMLLNFAAKAEVPFLSENDRNELTMFQAITQRDLSQLEPLGEIFEAENPAAALLCLDHCFTNPPKIQPLRVDGVAKKLKTFGVFVRLLNLFTWADPCNQPLVEKLFGFVHQGENNFLIPEGTFLHSMLRQENHPACQPSIDENVVLAGSELREFFQQTLKTRLRHRVEQENDMCKRTKAFSPCLVYSVFDGVCNRIDCPDEHIPAALIDAQEYNLRVRIHLQQILIYKSVQFVVNDPNPQRYWISRLYSALYPSFYRLGSASSLDLSYIPEAEAAFQVVKEWSRRWIYGFEFIPLMKFLSNLAQVARLSFQLDTKDAMSYLTQSPFIGIKPTIYLRRGGNYVVTEFLLSLQGKEETCISAGVLFVQHIVLSSLPIHISILCDIVEYLCTCIIVAERQQRGLIHDVTLPLSWLVNWTSVAGEGVRHTHTFNIFATCLVTLLGRLYSGNEAEHLLFDNKNLATLGWRIKDVFFSRICRCLCLLGYNTPTRSMAIRGQILRDIIQIRRQDLNPRFLPLSNKYVTAKSWSDLVRAIRASTIGSPLDEMVVLLHADRPQQYPIRNVRQIVYRSVEEIPKLLGSSRSIVESVSQDVGEQANETLPEEDDDGPIEEETSFAETGEPEEAPEVEAGPVAMPPALVAVENTVEEINAASTIQRAFRRVHKRVDKRKAEMAGSNLVAGCADFFAACLKVAATMEWPKQEYRLRFLGPLPHLLLCLDVVHATAQKQKKYIKKDLRDAKHEKLEALDKQLTQLTDTLKQVIQMQKALDPTAAVHRSRDLAALKGHASKAVQLMRDLPFKTPEGLTQHIDRAFKGICAPRVFVQASAQRKPMLNVEEEYY
ncbi:hypothetical protein DFH07DRAFT_853912 [Mycena maculata]|uniref:UvrD-like helicase ATP-binding domain-containing protein n=1 Tax=Mycena maculata TaxID=230809 RepID=A0AAD7HPY9_9AGAR|nr:hypothetical protein DFH07DRAFT_853912 [Mycena maculata]